MSAIMSAGWHGMGWINAIDRGIMDRFLVPPVSRFALVAASVVQSVVVILIQSLIIVGVAAAAGASFSARGVVLLLGLASLLGGAVCALSDGLALVARQEETLIGAVQFVVLPATFLSSGMMAANSCRAGSPTWRGSTPSTGPSSQPARPRRRAPTGRSSASAQRSLPHCSPAALRSGVARFACTSVPSSEPRRQRR